MSRPSGLVEVRENHRFDTEALEAYLERNLDQYSRGGRIQQFEGGQSNPTFLLTTAERRFVLRKKPPGDLLPSAHQVEREYRIYRALADTSVPVPKTYLLCQDEAIIGTPFYVMEFMDGRVFTDPRLPDVEPADRRALYLEMIRVLAAIHSVDIESRGLSDYGKSGNYFVRQTGRWTKQYIAAQSDDIPAMNRLIQWLPANVPDDDTTTIVHGDYQLYNLMFDPSESHCLAVLDWELSTLGNPLADLAYNCMKYHSQVVGYRVTEGDGIPGEQEVVAEYCRLTGSPGIENWNFCLAFSFFRLASIAQGVYRRGLQGNASSATALEMKDSIAEAADTAWQIAMR
jgi:aminoglycoside phosphotransferase (APT) family kinase protein